MCHCGEAGERRKEPMTPRMQAMQNRMAEQAAVAGGAGSGPGGRLDAISVSDWQDCNNLVRPLVSRFDVLILIFRRKLVNVTEVSLACCGYRVANNFSSSTFVIAELPGQASIKRKNSI